MSKCYKMHSNYWYGTNIKSPLKLIKSFFDYSDLESTKNYVEELITIAESAVAINNIHLVQYLRTYYAINSLIAACNNILHNDSILIQLRKVEMGAIIVIMVK